MIMRPGQQLLLPANPIFITASLITALALNFLQNMGLWGRMVWAPDLVALLAVFWSVHQPRRVGMAVAFLLGLAMDVHQGALLGQHALAYSVMSFLSISMHRRLLWFTVGAQALQVLPLFVLGHLIELALRLAGGGSFAGAVSLLSPLVDAMLWPVVSVVLLAPQRRAPDPDDHRPL